MGVTSLRTFRRHAIDQEERLFLKLMCSQALSIPSMRPTSLDKKGVISFYVIRIDELRLSLIIPENT